MQAVVRKTVDLSGFPDLVVLILGFRLHSLRALPAFTSIGRGLSRLRRDPPEGLLADERFLFAWNHVGIRQYWRDQKSLERFTRSMPHGGWWAKFGAKQHGCGFWHEMYSARGGIEAIYIDMPEPPGLGRFAPAQKPVGPMFSSAGRLARTGMPSSGKSTS